MAAERRVERLAILPCTLHRFPTFTDIDDPKGVLTFDLAPAAPGVASHVVDGWFFLERQQRRLKK